MQGLEQLITGLMIPDVIPTGQNFEKVVGDINAAVAEARFALTLEKAATR